MRTVVVTSTYTANPGEQVFADATGGAYAVTLPSVGALLGNSEVTVMKTDSSANAITLTGTVNGVANPTLAAQYNSKTIVSNGTVLLTKAST